MDESQQGGAGEQPGAAQTSLTARLLNVFVAPGEVFAEIKDRAVDPANWLASTVISIIAGIIFTMVVFSQPAIIQGMKDTQEKALQERVSSGKMTQQQADAATAASESFMAPTFLKSVGIIGVIFATFVWLFLVALFLWLVGRFAMGGQAGFMKMTEVSGMALMISALGAIVAMTLAVIYGNIAMTPSLILVVGHFDPHNRVHAVLAAVNVMNLWYAAVLSIGLGQTTGKGFCRASVWIFGLWALWEVAKIMVFVHPQ
jgi:hypothetical protein